MSATAAGAVEQCFGERVRTLRKARGLSQEWLAQRMSRYGRSIHQTTIAKIENGTRPVFIPEVAALAQIFDVSILELVRGLETLE